MATTTLKYSIKFILIIYTTLLRQISVRYLRGCVGCDHTIMIIIFYACNIYILATNATDFKDVYIL